MVLQTCFYDFWLSSYCCVRLRKAAILDLSKMADIEGAQLGSLEKLEADGQLMGYLWSWRPMLLFAKYYVF